MAIGLQEVDNLKLSNYLEKLKDDNILGNKTIYKVEKELNLLYEENKGNINNSEYECDLVSTRIVQLLESDDFKLSVDYFKRIHKYLFD